VRWGVVVMPKLRSRAPTRAVSESLARTFTPRASSTCWRLSRATFASSTTSAVFLSQSLQRNGKASVKARRPISAAAWLRCALKV
jgi:hypothetical protein